MSSYYIGEDSHKISPVPSLLNAVQAHFSQLFFIHPVLWPLTILVALTGSLQCVNVFLVSWEPRTRHSWLQVVVQVLNTNRNLMHLVAARACLCLYRYVHRPGGEWILHFTLFIPWSLISTQPRLRTTSVPSPLCKIVLTVIIIFPFLFPSRK